MILVVGDIADQLRGVTYAKDEARLEPKDGYLPILRANNITEDGLSFSDLTYVPRSRVSARQRLQRGDVVIAASSGSLDVVGKSAALEDKFSGSFGAFCKVLRPNQKFVDTRYFSHFFRTKDYRKKISSLAAGLNINNLKNEHLDKLKIPLPSLDEQRRIAAILDKADALRRKRKRALDLLDGLTRSIFLEMFGTLNSSLPRTTIAEIALKTQIGPFGSILHRKDYQEGGIPLINPMHINSGVLTPSPEVAVSEEKYLELKAYHLSSGDIVMGRRGAMGRCAEVQSTDKLLCGTGSLFIRPDPKKILPGFLQTLLSMPASVSYFEKAAAGVTMANLNKGAVDELSFALPQLVAQSKFIEARKRISHLIHENHLQAQLSGLVFSSIQSRAFSGQL